MKDLRIRLLSSLILLLIIYFSFTETIYIFFLLSFISFFAIDEFSSMLNKIFKNQKIYYFLFLLSILIYIIFFSVSIFIYLTPLDNKSTFSLIFILLICSLSDIGGYFLGKIIGGKKLTRISPNKTYAGVVGSFSLPLVVCSLLYIYLKQFFLLNINVLILIFLVSLISQFGDLIISFLKRKAKIKDTGSILPGHGGILDRIDGILFGLPFGIMLISI